VVPGKRQRLTALAGFVISAALTVAVFFYAPMAGIFTGGFLTLSGIIFYDRAWRKGWGKSVSWQLKKIEKSQESFASQLTRATEEIVILKDHVTETALNARTTAVTEKPQPARRDNRIIKEIKEDRSMPLAMRAGEAAAAAGKRTYEDIVSGQHELSDSAVKQVVGDAVKSERIEVFLQPIVRLPQRKVRFYELYARVRARPGLYLAAERYLKVAQETQAMRDIERLLLTECLDIIRETAALERAVPFFVNITPETLTNQPFMNRLLAFLGNYRTLGARLVFEMTQKDFHSLPKAAAKIMQALGQLGCAFSIDHVRNMDFDVPALQLLKVRYIKISATDMIAKTRSDQGFLEMQRIKRKLEGNGISLIVEKIESEHVLKELFDFDLNYGQGYLFGKPDLQGAYQEKGSKARRFV
jgi:cyclic-di-GMP phosphodiesterase TipF (flagellum assembly factor)